MQKIYIVVMNIYDGECTTSYNLRAYSNISKAEEHRKNCKDELTRIRNEMNTYFDKHQSEIDKLSAIIRQKIIIGESKGKLLDEQKRMLEINTKGRDIVKTHKYHPEELSPYSIDDEIEYTVEEIELL